MKTHVTIKILNELQLNKTGNKKKNRDTIYCKSILNKFRWIPLMKLNKNCGYDEVKCCHVNKPTV